MKDAIGWAVVGENELLWQNSCEGLTKDYFRVFKTEEAAKAHTVLPTDNVVMVKIEEA